MKPTTTQPDVDPVVAALTFLKRVLTMDQYSGLKREEAYALHADYLRGCVKESQRATNPQGTWAYDYHMERAKATAKRAFMCELVSDGQPIPAAIATALKLPVKQVADLIATAEAVNPQPKPVPPPQVNAPGNVAQIATHRTRRAASGR